jgi:transposase
MLFSKLIILGGNEVTKVELFETIRKKFFHHQKTIRQIAEEEQVHRRTVRQAINNAIPPKRKIINKQCSVLTSGLKHIIDKFLELDLKAPRKQRHSGERVYQRLKQEHNYQGSSATVRNYVYRQRKILGLKLKAFIIQAHDPGIEAEVDWYEIQVDFPTERKKIYIFQMRACFSGREFHIAFHRQNQQAFIEAHVAAFIYFGGVFKQIRYDNLSSAVIKILHGRNRLETEKFTALHSHYLFEAIFCLPGITGAHEKGGVECGVGRFRRTHLVPVPTVKDLDELNKKLIAACTLDDQRTIIGKLKTIFENWQLEITNLQPLPKEPFAAAIVCSPKVDHRSLVAVKRNFYSVPIKYVGQSVEVQMFAEKIHFLKKGQCIAIHNRCYLQQQVFVELEHYLALLKIKSGALSGSLALKQAKQNGKWPAIYDTYWQALIKKHGKTIANKHVIEMLLWGQNFCMSDVINVLEQAINSGCLQLENLKIIMRYKLNLKYPENIKPLANEELGYLSGYNRNISNVNQYDQLLGGKNVH